MDNSEFNFEIYDKLSDEDKAVMLKSYYNSPAFQNMDIKDQRDFIDEINMSIEKNITNVALYPVAYDFVNKHSLLSTIMGPVGSGKSVACLVKIFKYMMCIRKSRDGIRRSKFVVVRNTRKELKDTTIRTWMDWFGKFGTYAITDMNFTVKVGDIEAEVQFIALDDEKDKKKLLSLECTGIYFNEVREINPEVYKTAQERIGRYPSLVAHGTKSLFDLERAQEIGIELDYSGLYDDNGNIKSIRKQPRIQMECVIADTNPPMINSYFYKMFEKLLYNDETKVSENPKDFTLYRQPSGLSPNAENKEYLPNNYYENMIRNKPKDQTDVMVHVKYGLSEAGLGVYRNTFSKENIAKEDLFKKHYNKHSKLIIGFDFGLNPCCVIGQFLKGRLYIYDEIITLNKDQRGLEEMIDDDLKPLLNKKYKFHKLNSEDILAVGDPAGNQRLGHSAKVTLFKVLKGYKFRVFNEDLGNKPSIRIANVKEMLKVDDKTNKVKLLINESCNYLIDGFLGNYYYKADKEGYKDTPEKNQYSHIHDACQYFCSHIVKHGDRYIDNSQDRIYNEYTYEPVDSHMGY